MSVTFESIRFGTVEIAPDDVIEFPFGLIGLGGLRYALIDRNPGTGFLWLHSVDDPALALPVVSPHQFFAPFTLQIAAEDRERTCLEDLAAARLYVTVRATPNPLDITANLRAPLVIHEGHGYQVINTGEQALLQAPLFTLARAYVGSCTRRLVHMSARAHVGSCTRRLVHTSARAHVGGTGAHSVRADHAAGPNSPAWLVTTGQGSTAAASFFPAALRVRRVLASRMICRSMMRASNASSPSCAVTA